VERAYRHSTRVLGVAICLLGVAMVVTAVARGGGPLSFGVLFGLAFAAVGIARVYLAGRAAPAPRRR
jgi:hypothetical protein